MKQGNNLKWEDELGREIVNSSITGDGVKLLDCSDSCDYIK